jgi:hypothetical protein
MTAIDDDQTRNECDDVGTGGPGAPTPLVALEVLTLTSLSWDCVNLRVGGGWAH